MPPKRSTIRSIAAAASLRSGPLPSEVELLAELSPLLLATSDAAGRLAFANCAWENLLGWRPGELTGVIARDLIHPADRPELRRAVVHARGARGGVPGVELRTATRDGRWRGVSWHLRLDQGRWYAAGQDLGNRPRSERALSASESRFRALVEQVPAIVYTAGMGAEASWEYVSPQIETILGYTPEEWMASHSLWFSAIHPEDRERVLAEERNAAEHDGQLRSEYRMRRRDGEWIWIRDDATAIVGAGGQLLFQGVLLDITEARRAGQVLPDSNDPIRAVICDALDRDRLVLHAQPIVDIASGRVVQEELLVRIQPEGAGGLIMPNDFLPRAARFGLSPAIDRWVVSRAVHMAVGRRVEVNLSVQSLGDAGLPAFIESEIRAAGADPSKLVFEIAEVAAADDLKQAGRLAEQLAELGCGFALDDFGAGHGSFTYLAHLPVSYIKIDMEFVRGLTGAAPDHRVVKSIVDVAGNFGIETVAEGVESQEALEVLASVGVDYAQGFHLGRPAPTPGGDAAE